MPVVVNGVMYLSAGRRVVAVDADTGKEVWAYTLTAPARLQRLPPARNRQRQPQPRTRGGGASCGGTSRAGARGARRRSGELHLLRTAAVGGWWTGGGGGRAGGGPGGGGGRGGGGGPTASARGLSYWPGDRHRTAPRILFMGGNRLYAIDAATGQPVSGFRRERLGCRDLEIRMAVSYGGTPTIYRNVAIIGAATQEVPQDTPGNPRAFDVVTGKKLWEFWTVAQPGQPGHDTWGRQSRTTTAAGRTDRAPNMWAFHAPVDAERGIVYLPIGSPATNYYGGDRPGNNAYGNSIVAVDAQTGKYLLALPDRASRHLGHRHADRRRAVRLRR